MVILELIHALVPNSKGGLCLLGIKPTQAPLGLMPTHNNSANRIASAGDGTFKSLTYQLPMEGYRPTMAMTDDGKLGFDSGEGA